MSCESSNEVLSLKFPQMIFVNGSAIFDNEPATTIVCSDATLGEGSKAAGPVSLVCQHQPESLNDHSTNQTEPRVNSRIQCEKDLASFNKVLRIAYTVCGVVSFFFLLLTLLAYLSLPNLRNIQGRIVIGNVVTITLTTTFLILLYNVKSDASVTLRNETSLLAVPHVVCKVLGYGLYNVSFGMFCWMSIMCFDLFWTFARTTLPRLGKRRGRRFFAYLSFGIGAPVLMTSMVILLDIFSPPITLPGVGTNRCFLSYDGVKPYFYHPLLALLCLNTILFFITITSLWKKHKTNQIARLSRFSACLDRHTPNRQTTQEDHEKSRDRRDQIILFTKLFVIMGLSWLCDFIHVEVHGNHVNNEHCNFYVEIFLRVIGGFNMMRGFFIFLIFVWKRSVKEVAARKFPKLGWLLKISDKNDPPKTLHHLTRIPENFRLTHLEEIDCNDN